MSFLSAIAGGILSGIGSRSEGRRQSRQSREEREHEVRMSDRDYNNLLRSTEYSRLLDDSLRQRQRSEIARGWDNWNNPEGKPNRNPVALPSLADYLRKE